MSINIEILREHQVPPRLTFEEIEPSRALLQTELDFTGRGVDSVDLFNRSEHPPKPSRFAAGVVVGILFGIAAGIAGTSLTGLVLAITMKGF